MKTSHALAGWLLTAVLCVAVSLAAAGCGPAVVTATQIVESSPVSDTVAEGRVETSPASENAETPDVAAISSNDNSVSEPTKNAEVVSEIRPVRGTDRAAATSADVTDITFDTIKFDMKTKEEPFQRSMIGKAIEDLNGKTVRVRGYVLPGYQQRGLTQFILMRDNMECCFGPGAWIFDCIIVDMKPGKTTDFTVRPVAVEGTFSISEFRDADDVVRAVYHIDGQSVR